jgi:hypothetical protein
MFEREAYLCIVQLTCTYEYNIRTYQALSYVDYHLGIAITCKF